MSEDEFCPQCGSKAVTTAGLLHLPACPTLRTKVVMFGQGAPVIVTTPEQDAEPLRWQREYNQLADRAARLLVERDEARATLARWEAFGTHYDECEQCDHEFICRAGMDLLLAALIPPPTLPQYQP